MRSAAAVVWNFDQRRLRAGLRIAIFFFLWGFGPAVAHLLIGQGLRLVASSELWTLSIWLDLVRLAVVLLAGWFTARWVDFRPFAGYGFRLDRGWWADLCFGILLGALLMGGIFVFELSAGWVTVTGVWVSGIPGVPFGLAIWSPLVLFVVVAVCEELLSRGNQLLNITEGFWNFGPLPGTLLAWLLSSLVFGVLHFLNPNSTWLSTTNLVIYGLLLGAGFVLTGQLAIPIGLHFAWNFFQGSVFGFPVSGRQFMVASVVSVQQGGPDLWTGGAFGPEAGLLGLLAAAVGVAAIVGWVRLRARRVNFQPLYAATFQVSGAGHEPDQAAV